MDLLIALEYRFDRTPDGSVWTAATYPRAAWDRYLSVFGTVTLLARARDVPAPLPGWKRVDGDRVRVHALPHYVGPARFLLAHRSIRRAIRGALEGSPAVILRVPGTIGSMVARELERQGRSFALEVVGDPWDAFAPGASAHPLRPVFRRWLSGEMARQCRRADAVLYVTEQALQRRYPAAPRNGARGGLPPPSTFAVSDVDMEDDAFSHTRLRPTGRTRLLCVASMDQPYKGHPSLVDAVAICVREGIDLELTLVGDGRLRRAFEERVLRRGLEGRVRFLGQLPAGPAVREELDAADLFVLPSLVEGMPRALIEAMGRGLPCIGSRVGGIPELLDEEALVAPGDRWDLAARIARFAADPGLRARQGHRNLAFSRRFHSGALRQKREEFLRAVEATARRARTRSDGEGKAEQ